MSEISSDMRQFADSYLEDRRDINIKVKSSRYWKYGAWIAGGSLYISAATYYQSWPEDWELTAGLAIFGAIVTIISVLIWVNARKSDIDEETLSSHDIAQLIDAYRMGGVEAWAEIYENIENRLENNVLLPPKRLEELDQLYKDIDSESSEKWDTLVMENMEIITEEAQRSLTNDFQYASTNAKDTKDIGDDPGLIGVVWSATSSENINTKYVFWILFVLAALAGAGIAIWKGQGWGVLVVTILFFGLRYLEKSDR